MEKFLAACVSGFPIGKVEPEINEDAKEEAFCLMTSVFCHSKQLVYKAYKSIDNAIISRKTEEFGIESEYLEIHFRNCDAKYCPQQTLILRGLHKNLKENWNLVLHIVENATNYVLNIDDAKDDPSACSDLCTWTRLYYESSAITKVAKKKQIEDTIITAKSIRDPRSIIG